MQCVDKKLTAKSLVWRGLRRKSVPLFEVTDYPQRKRFFLSGGVISRFQAFSSLSRG
jgi:hypothetical protein